MKAPSLKQAKTASTALHALIVRRINPTCQAALLGVLKTPCAGPHQAAHIIPKRGTTAIRCDIMNGWGLCAAHHRIIDTRPDYWLDLVRWTVGFDEVDVWRVHNERCVRDGLGVSPLMFWRSTLDDLIGEAATHGVELDSMPAWVKARAGEIRQGAQQ